MQQKSKDGANYKTKSNIQCYKKSQADADSQNCS